MKTLKRALTSLVLTASLLATQANAAQWCGTKVSNYWINSGGDVLALSAIRGDYWQACNIKQDWKGITPTVCASWMTLIRSAIARNADMIWFYVEDTPCTAIPVYGSAPAPYYIMLQN